MAPRVVITRRLPTAVEARAKASFDVVLSFDDRVLNAGEIIALATGADALLPCVADQLDRDLIRALPASVRIIANFGVGTDHLDLEAARARGLVVTNTPGVLTDATADLTLLLILATARRATEATKLIRESAWQGWGPTQLMGQGLAGKRLGIVGMGRIGQAVATRARGFGMDIHYHNRNRLAAPQEQGAQYHESLASLLAQADILSLHCAATSATSGLIDAQALAQLPRGATLINTARGDIVDDDAVIAALGSGQLLAVGLDVFKDEPRIDPRYGSLENAFLLPHLGSATVEARSAMGMLALDNLDAFFSGKRPLNIVE